MKDVAVEFAVVGFGGLCAGIGLVVGASIVREIMRRADRDDRK